MAQSPWDLVVVGAGPAGSAAALAALRIRPDARVLLVDREDFPRDKPCGDGIAPHALDVLAGLGLPDVAADHRPVHRLHLAVDGGPHVVGDMRRPARVVPRAVLDARIRDGALAAGAVPATRTVRRLQVLQDGVLLDGPPPGRGTAAGPRADGMTRRRGPAPAQGTLRARVVVAADGAQSTLRRALGLARNGPDHVAVALRGYAPVRTDLADEQRIVFADDDRPAYAWSFPVGDGRANVGYGEVLRDDRTLTRARLLHRLDELLPAAAAGAVDLRGHHLPLSSRRPRQPDGRVLLVGDALSLINPMTGEGIYYAVLSGACAGAAAMGDIDAGRAYRSLLRDRLGRHLRHTTTVATLATRLPGVVPAGIQAAAADHRVLDDLVDLGLGRGLLSGRAVLGTARHLVGGGGADLTRS